MITGLNLSGLEKEFETPTLDITPPGLSPTKNPVIPPETSSRRTRSKPLFVFHLKDLTPVGVEDLEKVDDSIIPPSGTADFEESLIQFPADQSEVIAAPVSDEKNLVEKTDAEEQEVKREFRKKEEKLEVNLVERVQNLSVASPVEVSPLVSKLISPKTTPKTSPTSKRKISGVVMDQSATHSYFCTKAFQGSQQSSGTSAFGSDGSGETTGLSSASAQMTEQMENAAKFVLTIDPNQKMGRKRRPKPSTLREMNFWAPTSM